MTRQDESAPITERAAILWIGATIDSLCDEYYFRLSQLHGEERANALLSDANWLALSAGKSDTIGLCCQRWRGPLGELLRIPNATNDDRIAELERKAVHQDDAIRLRSEDLGSDSNATAVAYYARVFSWADGLRSDYRERYGSRESDDFVRNQIDQAVADLIDRCDTFLGEDDAYARMVLYPAVDCLAVARGCLLDKAPLSRSASCYRYVTEELLRIERKYDFELPPDARVSIAKLHDVLTDGEDETLRDWALESWSVDGLNRRWRPMPTPPTVAPLDEMIDE